MKLRAGQHFHLAGRARSGEVAAAVDHGQAAVQAGHRKGLRVGAVGRAAAPRTVELQRQLVLVDVDEYAIRWSRSQARTISRSWPFDEAVVGPSCPCRSG